MSRITKILNIILILAIVVGDICYTTLGGLWLKGLTSLFFVLLGACNVFFLAKCKREDLKFGIFMLIGLFVCFVADIVLNLNFMFGAIIFALGHVFYIIAYSIHKKLKISDLIPSVIIFVPVTLLIVFLPIFNFGGIVMELVCIIYALIISIMVGKSISNFIREKSLLNLLIMIGSLLFMFSDLMLLFANFANVSRLFDILCLATYYPGQAMLASSFYFGNKLNN